ncbi:MAG: metallophosphoesterase [Candidatus Caldarchaeum sp.]|nr:metallophosphoesterase [Candidatus Caldarchaeum sp.]MDW8360246.1 metallophosphoesterase [Candidatus Caldarchaeum sp.]
MRLVEGHPAVLLEKPEKCLVVADLHLGFEEELRLKGIRVPSYSRTILEELKFLMDRTEAKKLIIAGDLKHNIPGPSKIDSEILPKFLIAMKQNAEVVIIPGNHDGQIEKIAEGLAQVQRSRGLYVAEEEVAVTHGHMRPDGSLINAKVMVAGHLHPVLRIGGGHAGARIRVWLRLRASRKDFLKALYGAAAGRAKGEVTLLIMPSFNDFLQGRSVNDLGPSKLFRGPILRSGVFDIDEAEVITLDGDVLGTLGELRDVLK